ncbi:MAG: Tail Collar domain protein [Sphingomonas bacterium]|jgi:microcystin-dependent protein|uniref:phage tail protein n=1 Tax=Sphingomonas bacterium TaxID=1895847 RepID=UPI00261AAD1A|nr:tail fiber protein [Sphingomonas bacterium]MDB5712188.1 Tail Collar domain protein [Sphingomonas bacterium]
MTQPYIGEIRLFPWDWSVRGWALAQGQFLPIAQNQALFALIGTTYGGNGVTTFQLPDLRSRAAVGIGQLAGGSNYVWGEKTGAETVTLNTNQIPQHNHLWTANSAAGDAAPPLDNYLAGAVVPATGTPVPTYLPTAGSIPSPVVLNAATLANKGGNQPHSNVQPYLGLNYSIALQGLFPSRN